MKPPNNPIQRTTAYAFNRSCPLPTLDSGLSFAAKAASVEVWEVN